MQKLGKAPRAGSADTGPPKAAGCKASLPLMFQRAAPTPAPTFSKVYVARSMISGKCSSYSRMTSFSMSAGGERWESTWAEQGPELQSLGQPCCRGEHSQDPACRALGAIRRQGLTVGVI